MATVVELGEVIGEHVAEGDGVVVSSMDATHAGSGHRSLCIPLTGEAPDEATRGGESEWLTIGGGKDNQIHLAAFLELLLIISNVGTAVALYPIARRQNEALAIGYVGARIIESTFIAAGIIFVLGVVGLRTDLPSAHNAAFTLAALKDWCQLFGPGMIVPWGNGLILGYLMYKSGLVPRRMAWFGLIGGPLLLIGNFAVLFDWADSSGPVNILVAPEFIWEAFLGIYCAIWGFRKDSPIIRPNWRGNAPAA